MKFITEYDLRTKFNEQSFDIYVPEKDARLTPGARSFLSDRKIKISEADDRTCEKDGEDTEKSDFLKNIEEYEALYRIELVEAYFLEAAGSLSESDFKTANQIFSLRNHLKNLRKGLFTADIPVEGDAAAECPDFEISEFYFNSVHSRKILMLNILYVRMKNLRAKLGGLLKKERFYRADRELLFAMNELIKLICSFRE